MIINRIWCMPIKWTFQMKPVKELIDKYLTPLWIDPFAGKYSPAEITNDIEGRGAKFKMDALNFLKTLKDSTYQGALFDPPYSTEQCLRKYKAKYRGTSGRAEYWAKCKDEISRVIIPGGVALSFCWDSCGISKKRGFEIIEILLLCHGACHNDTIITVEKKTDLQKAENHKIKMVMKSIIKKKVYQIFSLFDNEN